MNSKKAVMLAFNSVTNTTRLFKISKFLIEKTDIDFLYIYGLWKPNLSTEEILDDKRFIFRLKNFKQKINSNIINKYALLNKFFNVFSIIPFYINAYKKIKKQKPDIIYCHDILWLPIIILYKKYFHECNIYYLPHELETEETGTTAFTKKILKLLERYSIKYIDHIVVVSEEIAIWYKNEYNIASVSVVRNIPAAIPNSKSKILREKFYIPDNDIIFIYQGLLNKSRGIYTLINVFANLKDRQKHIIFMGYGEEVDEIKNMSLKYENIHYEPAVNPQDIIKFTSSADVGIFFISDKNISLSYRYSLPNKYFEYVRAGLPVIVSDNLHSLSNEILRLEAGWIVKDDETSLMDFIEQINWSDIKNKESKVKAADCLYDWDKEINVLAKI